MLQSATETQCASIYTVLPVTPKSSSLGFLRIRAAHLLICGTEGRESHRRYFILGLPPDHAAFQVGSTVADLDCRLVLQHLCAGEVVPQPVGGPRSAIAPDARQLREAELLGPLWPYGKSAEAVEVRQPVRCNTRSGHCSAGCL